jgi:hypothetical protein
LTRNRSRRRHLQRHETPPIVVVAAFDLPDPAIGKLGEIGRPSRKRRQRGRGRQRHANGCNLGQMAPLHDGVDEMRGADHEGIDARSEIGDRLQRLKRGDNAARHVGRRCRLDALDNLAVGEQDGIGIGSADINSDTFHDWNTELKSRSYPKARGPTWSRPRGVRKTCAAGSAITVVRWP